MSTPVEEPRPDPLIGQTLSGRYQLTRKIGEGGMGTVYEAQHVVIGKTVAVKILREKYIDRPTVAQRLVQEARLASSIRHEHIIDITDSGATTDGRTFVVMEMLDGESLADLVRREGALPEARAIEIARQIASALGAAHARGIVHRDVKPENVFLVRQRDGRDFVKVVDFGISTTLRDSRDGAATPDGTTDLGRLTSTGVVMGTPFYMSPEQGRGDDDIDHRIDIYALGVIIYECLTAEVPFRGNDYLGIISKVLTAEAARPRALRPELRISEAAERVVMKAMSKPRDDRYPTMESLDADLQRVLAGEGVDAPAPAATLDPRAPAPRAWMFAAAAMVIIGGAALIWAGRTAGSDPRAQAPKTVEPPAPAPPAPPVATRTVVLHMETNPPGAEIRQGDRVFGVAPYDVVVPRSQASAHFTFVLDGYEPGTADLVPATDDSVRVKLTARPKTKPGKAVRPVRPPVSTGPATPAKPETETLPNPY